MRGGILTRGHVNAAPGVENGLAGGKWVFFNSLADCERAAIRSPDLSPSAMSTQRPMAWLPKLFVCPVPAKISSLLANVFRRTGLARDFNPWEGISISFSRAERRTGLVFRASRRQNKRKATKADDVSSLIRERVETRVLDGTIKHDYYEDICERRSIVPDCWKDDDSDPRSQADQTHGPELRGAQWVSTMKSRSKELLDRAINAMLASIEIYNKPDFRYRAESFAILATNAWELLLKAKWLADNNNRVAVLYARQGGGKKVKRIKKTGAGNPMTVGLDYLASRLQESGTLDNAVYTNIRLLSEARDNAVHFYHQNATLNQRLQEIGAATVRNFHFAASDWFAEDLSRFNFYLLPLAFVAPTSEVSALVLCAEEARFLEFISSQISAFPDSAGPYAVAVNVAFKFERSKIDGAVPMRISNDPDALRVTLTEQQIRDRYPLDYDRLTQICKARYAGFKAAKSYHDARKALVKDLRFAFVRLLDQQKQNSPSKIYYSEAIFTELDKIFMLREKKAAAAS